MAKTKTEIHPIGMTATACPHCGAEAKALWLVGSPNCEHVAWCENGHVVVVMAGVRPKVVFDFHSEAVTEGWL